MQFVETLVNHQQQPELRETEPALVYRGATDLQTLALPEPSVSQANWPLRFVVAAVLGAAGGLVAAVVLNPAPPRFSVYHQAPVASESTSTNPAAAFQPPVASTSVTVNVPGSAHLAALPGRGDEVQRLKTRNRRLEALVWVLRHKKKPDLDGTTRSN